MFLASDNTGPAHPLVMESLLKANAGFATPYGEDAIMNDVRDQIRAEFEAHDAAVYLVALGTAANALILSTLTEPWQTVFCHRHSHIHEDECNAPEFFMGGAKLTIVEGPDGKMTPEALRRSIEGEENRGVHGPQRGPVSITQVTEKGTVHSLEELRALTAVAKEFGLPTHLDGARFANAMMRLGCTPAEMSWKSGIDAVSFGGTKNGLLGVEAVIFFDPKHAWEFELRRKRAAHLLSKHRFLSAQMQAYLTDGLWRDLATASNAACARLARGLRQMPDVDVLFDTDANMIFANYPRATHQRLMDAGAQYNIMTGTLEGDDPNEMLEARFVTDWSIKDTQIDQFLEIMRG